MSELFQPRKYWESKILTWEFFRYSPLLAIYPPSWPLRIRLGVGARLIAARLHAGQRILDLGCGSGVLARRLHGRGFDYVGVDWASSAVNQAIKRNRDPKFQFREADVSHGLPTEAALTVFLGLTDWLSGAELALLFSRLRSPDLLFSYTETKAVSRSPYRLYRRLIDGEREATGYHARTYTEGEIRSLLDGAGYVADYWRKGSFFNPGVLVWARKKR